MTNFHQACRIDNKFGNPIIRESVNGKLLVGKIFWLDGKDKEGKNKFQNFEFSVASPEVMQVIQNNLTATFLVDGFVRNKSWTNDKGEKKYGVEIRITKASVYTAKMVERADLE